MKKYQPVGRGCGINFAFTTTVMAAWSDISDTEIELNILGVTRQ